MGLLLGALDGAGQAFNNIADQHINQWTAERLKALEEQVKIAQELRIEEMNKREGIRNEEAAIRAEGRAYEGKKRDREETFAFNTDPANAQRAAQAKLTEQSALDDYKYRRGSEEAKYRGMLARATDINRTGSMGGVSNKISEVDKIQIQLLGKEAEGLQKAIGEGMLQDEDMLSAKMRLREVRGTIQDTLAKYQGGSQSASTLDDPLGLRTPPAGNDDGREQLLRAIEATGATIDTLDNTRTEDLRAVLADARREKINAKLSEPRGLLSRAAKGRARAKEAEEREARSGRVSIQGGGQKRDILNNLSLAGAIARIKARNDWSDERKREAIARITERDSGL